MVAAGSADDGCVYAAAARVVDGRSIAEATITAEVVVARHERGRTGRECDAVAAATIEIVEKTTANTIVLGVKAEIVGKSGSVTFELDGHYSVVRGEGRSADATGNGAARIAVERGTLKTLVPTGEISRAAG